MILSITIHIVLCMCLHEFSYSITPSVILYNTYIQTCLYYTQCYTIASMEFIFLVMTTYVCTGSVLLYVSLGSIILMAVLYEVHMYCCACNIVLTYSIYVHTYVCGITAIWRVDM